MLGKQILESKPFIFGSATMQGHCDICHAYSRYRLKCVNICKYMSRYLYIFLYSLNFDIIYIIVFIYHINMWMYTTYICVCRSSLDHVWVHRTRYPTNRYGYFPSITAAQGSPASVLQAPSATCAASHWWRYAYVSSSWHALSSLYSPHPSM